MSKIVSLSERRKAQVAAKPVEITDELPPLALIDLPLVLTVLGLVLFGLVSVYTASASIALQDMGHSGALLLRQLLAVGVGSVVCWGVSHVHYRHWRPLAYPLAILSIALLVLTLKMGITANGSERWISLPFGFQFQPSEVAKVSAILLMAHCGCPVITPRKKNVGLRPWKTLLNLLLVGIMLGLIYLQPNLSVTLLVAAVTGILLFSAGLNLGFFIGTLPFLGMWVWQKIQTTPYQWRRIQGWLNPWSDPMDTGYNLIQSYYAIGSGGLFGVGLGRSIQKLYYLPFQHTDFIFAVICEELGFVGALILIAMFAMLLWRGFVIARNCGDPFGQLLALGLTAMLGLQTMLNLAVTLGLMPVTGVTLPFISYGGTSMIVTLGMVGMLLSISRVRITSSRAISL